MMRINAPNARNSFYREAGGIDGKRHMALTEQSRKSMGLFITVLPDMGIKDRNHVL